MKMLGRIALVIAILACAGALFFANKLGTIRDGLKADKVQLTKEKTDLTKALGDTKAELNSTKLALNKTTDDLNTANGILEGTKASLAQKTKEADGLKDALDGKSKELDQTKSDLATAQDSLNKIKAVTDSDDFKNFKGIKDQLASQTEENKILGQQMVAMRADNDALKVRVAELTTTPVNLRGHVAAVQDLWGFVVLDVGRQQRVQTNTDFLVYRDMKLVSKVQVRSVGQTTSVAEVLPDFNNPKSAVKPKIGDLIVH